MELIIKPTIACNFACTYCSAAGIPYDPNFDKKNVPEVLKDYMLKIKPQSLIVTGGDPLMMDPEYYYNLHEIIKDNEGCNGNPPFISITTNLKDFYLNPDKWTPLFNEPWFGVGTSFQYGDKRRWDKDTVYTEEMFLKVQELFKERTGHHAFFIAVIDKETEDTVIDLCKLAKSLDVQVKINNMQCVGRSEESYPRYKLYRKYFEIIEAGLGDWEVNCYKRAKNECPKCQFGSCKYTIHCAFVDKDGNLKVSICDEQMSLGHFLSGDDLYLDWKDFKFDSLHYEIEPDDYITKKCPFCDLFGLCNGCVSNREIAKKDPNYCKGMKSIESKIKEYGWWLP